jgi:hypothetical protein
MSGRGQVTGTDQGYVSGIGRTSFTQPLTTCDLTPQLLPESGDEWGSSIDSHRRFGITDTPAVADIVHPNDVRCCPAGQARRMVWVVACGPGRSLAGCRRVAVRLQTS